MTDDKEFVNGNLENYTNILKELIDYKKLKVVKGEFRNGPASSCSNNALTTRRPEGFNKYCSSEIAIPSEAVEGVKV